MPAGTEEANAALENLRYWSTATLTGRGRAKTHAGVTGTKNMLL